MPWRTTAIVGYLIFTLFWDGFLVFMAFMMFADGAVDGLIMLGGPHSWVGIGLAYYTPALLLNQTIIRADSHGLSVRHGPIPWIGNRCPDREDLDQLYVVDAGVRVNNRSRWNLSALDSMGLGRTVIHLLKSAQEARWLEQQLEAHLGIQYRHVPGEV